jgi:flagellar hook-associated protein 1 FlgK
MKISTFESDDGSLTVMGAGGNDLVRGNHSFDLSLQNDRIMIAGSGTSQRDITDAVQNGKMGGWLDMRDNVVGGYQQDLGDLGQALIWQVNAQHSQGAGLSAFDTVTGTYGVENTDTVALADGASGLAFSDKIDASGGTGFKFWVYDDAGEVVPQGVQNYADIAIDSTTTLEDLVTALNGVDSNITAGITDANTLEITGANGYSFAFSEDTSNVLAALGINTFFTGETAGDMAVNGTIQSDNTSIAAGYVQDDGSVASGDNTNAIAIADLQATTTSIGTAQGRVGQLETTTENYYYTMLSSMGTTFSGITSKMETSEVMVHQLNDMRESISGVSLDEEMVNLMSYQSAYASAAKLITTADEMMDTLLGIR